MTTGPEGTDNAAENALAAPEVQVAPQTEGTELNVEPKTEMQQLAEAQAESTGQAGNGEAEEATARAAPRAQERHGGPEGCEGAAPGPRLC